MNTDLLSSGAVARKLNVHQHTIHYMISTATTTTFKNCD